MQDTTAPSAPPGSHIHTVASEDRVPLRQKIGYGCGTFFDMWGHWLYPTIAFQIFGNYLGTSFFLIGWAVILNRLFDAISDPLFGWLSDNTRTRWGRRRPYMLVGCVLAAIGLPFLLAVTPQWSGLRYFGFMLLSSAIYLPIVSCFNMPYQSLANEMTPDYHERTSVFVFKNAIQKIPELGLFFFGRFFSMAVWVGADNSNAWERIRQLFTSADAWRSAPDGAKVNMLLGGQVYLALCGIIMLVCGLICVLLVRERYYGKLVAQNQTRISIKDTLWQTLQCRPFLIQKVMDMGYNMGLSMVGTLGLSATFYYVCGGNESVGNWWNWWMGVSGMVLGFCGIPVYAFIARRVGKRHAMMSVLGTAVAVFVATWWLYTPDIVWLQIFASGFIAFTGAGYWTLSGSMGADVMDYDELEGGRRREGSFAACGSWINKVAMAGGAGISFFILGWIGVEGHRPEVKPAQAGDYSVVVTEGSASITSDVAKLTVIDAPAAGQMAPSITTQPASVAVVEGQAAALCVGVQGSAPFTYEWKKNGVVLSDAHRAHLVIDKLTAAEVGDYTVTVTNAAGSITSPPAKLSLVPATPAPSAPVMRVEPTDLATTSGEAATLMAAATGGPDLKYQWRKDGADVPGATGPILSLTTTIQPPHTIFMIRLLLAAIPIVGLTFSMIALTRFPLTQEKMAEIRAALEARRGRV